MTLTTHAVVGAAAASLFPTNPYLAFAAGFISHLAIDSLPHYDYSEYLHSIERSGADNRVVAMPVGRKFFGDLSLIGADALLGFVLTFVVAWILRIPPELALIGAGAGIYPDLLQFVCFKVRGTRFEPAIYHFHKFHIWIQEDIERPWWGWKKGFLLQALFMVAVVSVVSICH